MPRVIDPPRSAFGRLPTKLTAGELQVIDLFDGHLTPSWEMYVQPHLNGLRPDLVLLHPNIGIAVFEVKDWDLTALRVSGSQLRGKRGGRDVPVKDPIAQISLYKNEIYELYCPTLNDRAGRALITAGLVFTMATSHQAVTLLDPLRSPAMRTYPKYYPIGGSDDLRRSSLDGIFPEWRRPSSVYMTSEIAEDLRGWLRDPAFSREGRIRPIPLSAPQQRLTTTRTQSGYRRIRGAAGSGKSVVVACRAAQLAREGNRVLVVCFNITLLNYLRDLAVRHVAPVEIRKGVEFLNFHQWCKRICRVNAAESYRGIWRRHFGGDEDTGSDDAIDGAASDDDAALRQTLDDMVDLVQSLYRTSRPLLPTYDAILVDEGQDFDPRWWQTLRHALEPGGEMMLVDDNAQDIYGTASAWTREVMRGCGFTGQWSELKDSYRLPQPVIPFVRQFGERFLKAEVYLPTDAQTEQDIDECNLRWVHVEDPDSAAQVCFNEIITLMGSLPPKTAVADLTFICSSNELGRDVVERLKHKRVRVRHTFGEDGRVSQRQKRALFQGDASVKATTIHSYKGWEGKQIVVFIKSIDRPKDKALLYTAMTRLRRDQLQSSLTVVSSCRNLGDFGRKWPDYHELP